MKNSTQEQKHNRKNICFDIMKQLTENPDLLTNVMDFPVSPGNNAAIDAMIAKKSKTRMSKSKVKSLLIILSDKKDIIMIKWVSQGQTFQQKYYREVLIKLRE